MDLSGIRLSPFDLLSLNDFLSRFTASILGPAGGGDSVVSQLRPTHEAGDRAPPVILTEVNLNSCELASDDIDFLSLRNLTKLKLSNNYLSCACAANLLANNPQLKVVELTFFHDDAQPELFASALRQHPSLNVLSISESLFKHGIPSVFKAIHNHHSLLCLNLYFSFDMEELAAVLSMNTSLLELGVRVIDPRDLQILAGGLKANKTLEKLEVEVQSTDLVVDELDQWKALAVIQFVHELGDCHLKILVIDNEGQEVPRKYIQLVNCLRREQGLPLLDVVSRDTTRGYFSY